MELILDFCTKLIVNVFELYVLYRYMGTFFAGRLRRPRFLAALIGVKLVMTLFVDYLVPYVWINILTSLCIIFFMTCCYESTHNKRIMISIFLIILLMLSEAVIALATGIGGYHILSKAENHQTVELFASRLIFWLMFLLIRRFRNIHTDIHLPVKVWVLGTVLVVVTLLQMMFLYSDTTLDKRIAS
ncbi:MAG: hypothetical protein IJ711_12655, partial [Lachnospiraceae bacterium]|nr:hypothetical protein [Lachnospiraceae bacterium]